MANLSELTNEQREAHRAAVCKAVGLDPDPALGMLDYFWMVQEDGMRGLVLYAKRNATELLREIHGVSVTKMTREDGPGFVSFEVEGTNKAGRREISIGSAATEGLRGERLASAVMTASTRGLRRLALQFAGHGLLDESEVRLQLLTDGPPAASGAVLAGSPMVIPPPAPPTSTNASPGRDITPNSEPIKTTIDQTPEEFSAAQQALRDEAKAQLMAKSMPGEPAGYGISDPPNLAPAAPAKQKRTRARRNTVSIASPGQEPVTPSLTPQVSTPAIEVPVSAPPAVAVEKAQPVPAQASVAPPSAPPTAALDPEKAKEFRERLRVYYNDVLPKGGMLPSENIGGPTMKMRKFATTHTGAGDMNSLSLAQWEDLFDFLDNYTKTNGAQALVQYIDRAIGVTK
jgi:hypothetical protein